MRLTRKRRPKLPPETERSFQRKLLQLAKLLGWRSAHFRPARTAQGWRTAVEGDGKGFPDTVLVRGSRLVFAELKRQDARTTPEQDAWLEALSRCLGVEVHIWRPSDWPEIERVLR